MLCGGSGPLCRLQGPHPLASAPAPSLPPLFILSVIISSCLVSAVLNPITPSPEEGVGSCSAGTAQGLSPVGTLRALGGTMEPAGPPCTPQMGSGLGTLCQNPLSSTGKDPKPLPVEPTPLPCPQTARGPAPCSDPRSLLLSSWAPNTMQGWEWGPCSHPRPPLGPAQGPAVVSILLEPQGGPWGGTLVPPPPPPHYGAAPQLAPPAQQQGRGGVSGLPPPRGRATSM